MKQYKIYFDSKPENLLPIYKAVYKPETHLDGVVSKNTQERGAIPVFTNIKELNQHFLKPIKNDIKGKPQSSCVVYILAKFFERGDLINNSMLKDIMSEIDPSIEDHAILNATKRLHKPIVRGTFMGLSVKELLNLKNKQFPDLENNNSSKKTQEKQTEAEPTKNVAELIDTIKTLQETRKTLQENQSQKILDRLDKLNSNDADFFRELEKLKSNNTKMLLDLDQLKFSLTTNIETTMATTLLKHDERIDELSQFVPHKDKINQLIPFIKDMKPENFKSFIEIVKTIQKAFHP